MALLSPVRAADPWVPTFWPKAQAAGISEVTFKRALDDFMPDPDILRSSSNQAEFVKPVWSYLSSAVSADRVETGGALANRYRSQLAKIQSTYGVDGAILVAIWGIE